MEAKLVVVTGKAPAGEYDLQLPTIIGRSRSANIPIGQPLISRQHCEIYEVDGLLMVRDLGSLNGTYVDEMRLADEPMTLAAGHRLTVGAITFQARYEMPVGSSVNELPDFSDDVEPDAGTQVVTKTVRADDRAGGAPELPAARPKKQEVEEEEENAEDLSPPTTQRDQGFDLDWLEDPEPEPQSSSKAPEPAAESPKQKSAAKESKPPKPAGKGFFGSKAKQAKPSKAASPAGSDETIAYQASTGQNDADDGFAPPERKAAAASGEGEDEENLDDFFKNLQ